jgi:hypothetical protein
MANGKPLIELDPVSKQRKKQERILRASRVIDAFLGAHSNEEIKALVGDVDPVELLALVIQHVMNQGEEIKALKQTLAQAGVVEQNVIVPGRG